ncbi:hypothetical protein MHYP_G00213170 [Metynnis hypsauchen]
MVLTLSVLLWVFHVAASFPREAYAVDFEPPNELNNSDSDMDYLLPFAVSKCVPAARNFSQGDPDVIIELPFVQHSRCSCRSRKSLSASFIHF